MRQMITRLILLCGMSILFSSLAYSETALPLSAVQIQTLQHSLPEDETVPLVWKGDAITIALPVGKEKRLQFPEPIQADVNGSLTTDQLQIINNDQNLYLTAQKTFSKTRIYVTLKKSQQIVLLDLLTADTGTTTTRKIILSDTAVASPAAVTTVTTTSSNNVVNPEKALSADAYVGAIRFAWQQLYAPERLLTQDTNFTRTPMHTEFWLPDLVYGDKVLAHPEASWQADGLYITAIELRNKYPHVTRLNLAHDLCGDWQAATLYPRHQLKPAGDKSGDSTTLFLISAQPLVTAMEICHGRA